MTPKLMRNTYWHTSKNDDATWLKQAVQALQSNAWTTPLYIDGSGWNAPKERAAKALLECLANDHTSCPTLILQNAILNSSVEHALIQCTSSQKTSLRSLTLRNITSLQASILEEAYPLPAACFANFDLESITLVKVYLDEESCESFMRLLQETTTLTSLTLDQVHVTCPFSATKLLHTIASSSSLTHVKLAHLESSEWNLETYFQVAASQSSSKLTRLCVESCQLNASHALPIAQLLQQQQQGSNSRSTCLEHLSLRHNQLDGAAVEVLVSQGLGALKCLFLSRNPLENGLSASILSKLLTVQELCLMDCNIPPAACHELLQALATCKTLRKLHLDGNQVQAQHVLDLLQSNVHLVWILDRLQTLARRHDKTAQTWKQVQFLLRANQSHRRILSSLATTQPQVFPHVLSRSAASHQSDVLFHAIQHMAAPLTALHSSQPPTRRITPLLMTTFLKPQESTVEPRTFQHEAKPRLWVPRSA